MNLTTDREICTGAGNCVRLAPDWFAQDNQEGLVILLSDGPPADLEQLMHVVVDTCPTGAIRLDLG